MKHRTIKIDTIKPYRLKASDKKIWSKFMTPKYVYTFGEYGDEYIYLRFEGYDHMEQMWRIVKIAEVKKISKALDSIITKWMTANPGSLLTEKQLFDDYRCGQLLLTDSEENALLIVMPTKTRNNL